MAQAEEVLQHVLEKIAAEEKCENYTINVTPITSEGANYTSGIYKAVITSSNGPDLKLFAKVAILSDMLRQQMQADRMFDMERYVYTELASRYDELQTKHEIPPEDRFAFPKFYGYNSNHREETIVLEDLVAQGYIMYDRFQPIDWDYASKAVEKMAKLHALWFSYKEEYPEEYIKNYSKFVLTLDTSVDDIKDALTHMTTAAFSATPENMKDRLRKFADGQVEEDEIMKNYGPGKHKVLIHGDYRASNILYKMDDGRRVEDLVPVDYQTMRLGSPATDLLYLIYSGTDAAFRRQHQKRLLDLYYTTFSAFLRQLGQDPELVYSRQVFDDDFKDMLSFGLNTAIFLLPLVLVDTENAPQVATGEGIDSFAVKPNELYAKRFRDILDDFVGYGLL